MKRFYKDVRVVPLAGVGYEIHLDGRPVRLSETKAVLRVSRAIIADAVAREWEAQDGDILPDTMPIMQIVSTCLERVASQRLQMQAQILRYVDTDLLFYRADEAEPLSVLQARAWDPLLDKFKSYCGVDLSVTTALVALEQDRALHDYIADVMGCYSDEEFTVFQIVVSLLGSVVSGILFMRGDLQPQEALAMSRVEERYKDQLYDAETYGPDPSIEKADKVAIRDLEACRRYLSLIGQETG